MKTKFVTVLITLVGLIIKTKHTIGGTGTEQNRWDSENRHLNEITKGFDEGTSEVKSSSVVKWEENLPMGFHSKEKPKDQMRLVIPPQLNGIEN